MVNSKSRKQKAKTKKTESGEPKCAIAPDRISDFRFQLFLRRSNDLPDGFLKADGDVPSWVVAAHFCKVTDVTNVVADAVFIHILIDLRFPGEFLGDFEGFPDRAGIVASTPM